MRWYSCGELLAAGSPLSPQRIRKVLSDISRSSVDTSPEFMTLVLAVIAAESNFNSLAESPAGATGLMQVTLIGAKEAAKQCRLSHSWGGSDVSLRFTLFDARENVKHGSCLLKFYMNQVENNVLHALVLYNGGYQQLTRLINTGTVVKETSEYILRVHSYLGRCRQ